MSVPKIIHYCWFGGNPMSEMGTKCIASWKEYLPGYEIKRWDETNFDININSYVKEAYEQKKWAFVSDFARFWILYNYGGLYFDVDVELIKTPSEEIVESCFMGEEDRNHNWEKNKSRNIFFPVNTGLGLSAASGLKCYKELIEYYDKQHFVTEDGKLNLETVVERVSNILTRHGFKGDKTIEHIYGITIYPPEYFCPMNPDDGIIRITDNSVSIHYYADSWHSDKEKKAIRLSKKFENKGRVVFLFGRLVTLPVRVSAKFERLGFSETIRFATGKFKSR